MKIKNKETGWSIFIFCALCSHLFIAGCSNFQKNGSEISFNDFVSLRTKSVGDIDVFLKKRSWNGYTKDSVTKEEIAYTWEYDKKQNNKEIKYDITFIAAYPDHDNGITSHTTNKNYFEDIEHECIKHNYSLVKTENSGTIVTKYYCNKTTNTCIALANMDLGGEQTFFLMVFSLNDYYKHKQYL